MDFGEVIIPIAVSCVMPIMLMYIIAWAAAKKSEHKMNVMIKAIESGADIDPNVLMAVKSRTRSTRMNLVNKLGAGVVLSLMGLTFILAAAFGLASFPLWGYYPGIPLLAAGIGLLVSFFYGRNFLKSEIEAEGNR